MKVLIDTNVLVSAALKDRDPEIVILSVVEQSEFHWIVSAEVLQEYREVLSRPKFKLPPEILQQWLATFDKYTTTIDVQLALEFPRDQKDAKFLACAIAADAEYFITGDRDFSEAQKLVKTTDLSVSLFKKLILDQAS